jgi:uncharacterized protein with FMN-binding domain
MKSHKPLAALVLTGLGSALVVAFQVPAIQTPTTASSTAGTAAGGAAATEAPATSAPTTGEASAAPTTGASSGWVDGTYAGSAVDEPWGTFQVQATISSGALVEVTILASPGDRRSSRINDQAVPLLNEAALAAQSASVDWISGATWTSQSYTTSLQAALDAAAA